MRNWRIAGIRQVAAAVGITLAVALAATLAPASARAPELAMLDGLAVGKWDIRVRDDDTHSSMCLRSGRDLIQLRHRQAGCSRTALEDQPNLVTVEYSCNGAGYGRTTIRRETAQLVQINSQGIQNGLPFHFNAEARRVGGC